MSIVLLHSPADITRQLLIDLGVGTDPEEGSSWPVYAAEEPNAPDNVLTLYDTTPVGHGRDMNSGEGFRHYGIQIRVRAVSHYIGFMKAAVIRQMIEEEAYQNTVVIDGTSYFVHCLSVVSLLTLGKETPNSQRRLFTVNAIVPIRSLTN